MVIPKAELAIADDLELRNESARVMKAESKFTAEKEVKIRLRNENSIHCDRESPLMQEKVDLGLKNCLNTMC